MRLRVHVRPDSSRAFVGGSYDGALAVRVRAPAVNGAATKELLAAIAEAFDLRKGAVTLVRGSRSRVKTLNIEGNDERLGDRLRELLAHVG